jgi:hypothetical protein
MAALAIIAVRERCDVRTVASAEPGLVTSGVELAGRHGQGRSFPDLTGLSSDRCASTHLAKARDLSNHSRNLRPEMLVFCRRLQLAARSDCGGLHQANHCRTLSVDAAR